MLTQDFDFQLPPDLVALRPAEPRGSARLLVVHPDGRFEHRHFGDLPEFLNKHDAVSFNDSRVIPARLSGRRASRMAGGEPVEVEVTLHRRVDHTRFRAFAQPAKRLREGDVLVFGAALMASIALRDGGEIELAFDRGGPDLDQAVQAAGVMPLPPYIAKLRAPDARDNADYQTIFAAHDGSVAAPTAGLHFTPQMLSRLDRLGVRTAPVTLHVGAGTFLPVTAESLADHRMHLEAAILEEASAALLNQTHAQGGRIVAVGTTALRTLESAAEPDGTLRPYRGETDIFISPGYRFRAVDVLLTNFHLPRSTLFMLVSAFMGLETMRAAYAEAIARRYRFYSYGDACLLLRPAGAGTRAVSHK